MMALRPGPDTRHVQVWFGEHVICQYKAGPALAERYAAAMARRFAGLRVTNSALPADRKPPDLPGDERMWEVTPK